MKLILCEDVPKVGIAGETRDVSDGFARNFLLPRGLAYPATAANLKKWQSEKRVREIKLEKNLETARNLAKELEAVSISISARAGREGHLFGSITSSMVAQALLEKGFSVDKRTIVLETPIKTLGSFEIPIRLHTEIQVSLKVQVTAANESIPQGSAV